MKYRKRRVNLSLVLLFGLLAIAILPIGICIRNAYAIYSSDTTSYVKVGELYDDAEGMMNPDNVNTLLRYITGNSSITYENALDTLNALATSTQSSADIRSKSVTVNGVTKASSQDVIVRFGGLDWQVVYLSKDTDGNNILTLWLSSSRQDAFAGRSQTEGKFYGYINNSLYSDWSNNWTLSAAGSYPSNMYGTSYIRAVTLNNGGAYATSTSATTTASQNANNVFARFTMEEVNNSLTSYLVTPEKMEWQQYQSTPETCPRESYYRPNDSLNDPTDIGLEGSWYNSSYNYENKTGYQAWANDYIWLPSLAETGYNTSNLGLWETSTSQRQNYSSSTSNNGTVGSGNANYASSYNYSWLRSGRSNRADSAGSLSPSGSVSSSYGVSDSLAVRPALHLNLNSVALSATPRKLEFSLNQNGGTGGTEKIWLDVEEGKFYSDKDGNNEISKLPSVPSREAYEFLGYYSSNTAYSDQLIDENGNFTSVFTTTYFEENATLYAVWDERIYRITLNANGGSGGTQELWLWYQKGFYFDSSLNNVATKLTQLPTSIGFTFNGYTTQGGQKIIDSAGNIIGNNTFTTSNRSLYAQWVARNPAYYDETGDYWYIENGYMPQSRVTDEETISMLNSSTLLGESYNVGGMPLASRKLSSNGAEYCMFDDNWYLVEPIRWRLEYNSNQTAGWGTEEDTLAIMAEIVYIDVFSSTSIGVNAGYSSECVPSFKQNQINETFLVTETKSMPTFGSTSINGTLTSVTSNIFVASVEEINTVADSGKVKISDFVKDWLKFYGMDAFYYTRDLGTNYNNIVCMDTNGSKIQYKPQKYLGVQFAVKVSEYACI